MSVPHAEAEKQELQVIELLRQQFRQEIGDTLFQTFFELQAEFPGTDPENILVALRLAIDDGNSREFLRYLTHKIQEQNQSHVR